jgi:hypothetical protein
MKQDWKAGFMPLFRHHGIQKASMYQMSHFCLSLSPAEPTANMDGRVSQSEKKI